jgi:hypothetical protein
MPPFRIYILTDALVQGHYQITSGFWPRVRARALRAPVFLTSLTRQTGRCAPRPAHRSSGTSYSTPKNIYNLSNLGRPRQVFPLNPIAASLILPAIFLRSNYVPMRPYALIFSVFPVFPVFSIFFGSFLFVNFLIFLLSFSISSYSSLLILLFLSLLILLVGAILRLLILPFLDQFGVKIHEYTGATRRPNFFCFLILY